MSFFCIVFGLLGILYTVFLLLHSNINLGVIMPAIMGFPPLIYGLFPFIFSEGFMRFLLCLGIIVYFMFFALAFYCVYLMHSVPVSGDSVDVIIVCGCAVRNGKMSLALEKRMSAALSYLKKNSMTYCVVSGGKGPQEAVSEASLMREYLLHGGIAEERILFEDCARSTRENMQFSSKLIKAEFGSNIKIAIVTTDFHAYRALCEAEKLFGNVEALISYSEWYMRPSYYLRETAAIVRGGYLFKQHLTENQKEET